MPKGFVHVKRHTAPNGPGPGRPRKPAEVADKEQRRRHRTHKELAELLWAPEYDNLIRGEAAEHPQLAEMLKAAITTHASTYGLQGRGGADARQRQVELSEAATTGIVAQVRRLGNKRDIPLVVAARSLSWPMTMARTKQWKEERKMRRLVDRSVAMSILEQMTALAPPPSFDVNPLVKLGFVDQTYMQNYHYGSRRHVRVQHVDAAGAPVQRAWDVYVNSIELPVPPARHAVLVALAR